MTSDRRRAFEQSTLTCVRSLYHFDRGLAWKEVDALAQWNSRIAPLSPEFPRSYGLAFRLGGLGVAEGLARWSRPLRRTRRSKASVMDFDAP